MIRPAGQLSRWVRLVLGLSLLLWTPIAQSDERLRIVDVHVHTSPSFYRGVDDVLTAMGISRFVNLSGGTIQSGLKDSLDAAHSFDGRLKVCVNLDWGQVAQPAFVADVVRDHRQAQRQGAAGLKISKALGLYIKDPARPRRLLAIDAPMLDPIWEAAGQLGLPIFIHSGDPKAFFEAPTPANERYAELTLHPNWSFHDARFPRRHELLAARDRVLARHPSTTFIGVHFANNPEDLKYVDQLLNTYPNLYVDLAARLPEIGRHDADRVRALFIRHQDRILFGTDLGITRGGIMLGSVGRERPIIHDIFAFYARHFQWLETDARQMRHPTPIQGDWHIDAIGLPKAVLGKIYGLNAIKLFWPQQANMALDKAALETGKSLADFID
ncbi:MAG: amidohydrolase family protein [Myxococcota bacterium]|nr:amidohydrolase family protein [Myxococcota bacterium]